MYDVLPETISLWQHVEKTSNRIFSNYGFTEIRFPIVEKTELFHSAIGQSTDVVEKEMYTFNSRSDTQLSLRPEGTAGCVRAVIQNELCNRGLTQKLWYSGPMFRYERPQKGRNRQFNQIGAEIFGFDEAQADAELILMSARLWQELKIPNLRLEVNTLGTSESRKEYRSILIEYFESHKESLDEDALRRLYKNPLRILDSKNSNMKEIIKAAPLLKDYLDEESKTHFHQVLSILDECGIEYQINSKLVRGLDYYSKTVFEWITPDLGSQGAICAGGRYDSLVELQGGKSTPAVGFAMGVDRIVELITDLNLYQGNDSPDVYIIADPTISQQKLFSISEEIREQIPSLKLITPLNLTSFKSQFKKADKSGSKFAIILGEDEITSNKPTLKSLTDKEYQQKQFSIEDLIQELKNIFNGSNT